MLWWLWLITGAVAGVAVFVGLFYVLDTIDNRASAKRQAIRSRQYDAEREMQKTVQNTIQDMFNVARGIR